MEVRSRFEIIQYYAGTRNSDNCGANGLPVTPNSITIIGNYKSLIAPVVHTNLVHYVDCFRSKHGKQFGAIEKVSEMCIV